MKDIVGSIYVSLGILIVVLTNFNSFIGPDYLIMLGWSLVIIGIYIHFSTQIKDFFKSYEQEENKE